MATLTETSVWAAGIYRIERTDPVVGADPVTPANVGISNVQARDLANRTLFLRDLVEDAGLGVDVGPLVADLNLVTVSGRYRAAAGASNAPIATGATLFEHLSGATTNEAAQEAFNLASNRSFIRRKVAGVWQAWSEQLLGSIASPLLAQNGWTHLPSGLIMQWGTGLQLNNTTVSFPIAFPNEFYSMSLADLNVDGVGSQAHIIGYRQQTLSGFTLTVFLHDGTPAAAASGFNFIAIGR